MRAHCPGQNPSASALIADGHDVYLHNLVDGTLSHVDLLTHAVVGNAIAVGNFPVTLLITGQDTLFADGFDPSPGKRHRVD